MINFWAKNLGKKFGQKIEASEQVNMLTCEEIFGQKIWAKNLGKNLGKKMVNYCAITIDNDVETF